MLDGACLAADERLLRWPEEKEDCEASVTLGVWVGGVGYGRGTGVRFAEGEGR